MGVLGGMSLVATLPGGPAEPLHILGPRLYPFFVALERGVQVALMAAALWWLWRQMRRRQQASIPHEHETSTPSGGMAIADLRRRFMASEDFREGCHELAATLRAIMGRRLSRPLGHLTAHEIERELTTGGDKRHYGIAALFELLAELQFQRRDPGKESFLSVCEMAESATGGAKPGRSEP